MNGGILRIDDSIARNHSIQLDTFDFNGGTIHALTGDITISSPTLTVDGGTLLCPADREIRFQASPTGTGFEAISVDGEVIFNAPGAMVTLQAGGTLDGSGTLQADLVQNGEVAPGNSTGTLTVEGDLNQSASAATSIELSPTGTDLLNVTGTATLAGSLTINLIDGGSPALGDSYTILTASSVTGTFADITVNGLAAFDITYNATSVVLTATNPELDFSIWAEDAFTPAQLADPLVSGPGADPDLDGIANLFEFIFGYSPTSDGDSFPVQFTTIPDPVDASRKIPVFEVTTVTGRTGYALDILSIGALDTVADDQALTSTATSGGGGVIVLRADLSFPDSAGFFALRATLLPD